MRCDGPRVSVRGDRELFEETGLLLGFSGAVPDLEEQQRVRREVLPGAMEFWPAADAWGLRFDPENAGYAWCGRWITPHFSRARFNTNFFLVDRDGALRTPLEHGVLLGVTRSSVIALAEAEGRKVLEEPLRPEALFGAAEAFLTGTSASVWPIASVDGRAIGSACPGPVSEALGARFRRVLAGEDPAFASWLSFVDEGG